MTMLTAKQTKPDPHAAKAAEIFKVPVTDVTPEQRRFAKLVTFSFRYGMPAKTLAQTFAQKLKDLK